MRVEVTDEAVLLTELDDADRVHLETIFRRTAGKSLILPRRSGRLPPLDDGQALEALIACMRTSAQDTLAALRRHGFDIARRVERV